MSENERDLVEEGVEQASEAAIHPVVKGGITAVFTVIVERIIEHGTIMIIVVISVASITYHVHVKHKRKIKTVKGRSRTINKVIKY